MSQVGGNLEQLEQLEYKLRDEAADVVRLRSQIDGVLLNTWWIGPAAQRFKDAWKNDFKVSLGRLEQALNEAKSEVHNRKEALRSAGT